MKARVTRVMRAIAVAGLMLSATALDGEKLKPNYKVTRLSVQDVGISCLNGQMPDVKKIGHAIVISCDAE